MRRGSFLPFLSFLSPLSPPKLTPPCIISLLAHSHSGTVPRPAQERFVPVPVPVPVPPPLAALSRPTANPVLTPSFPAPPPAPQKTSGTVLTSRRATAIPAVAEVPTAIRAEVEGGTAGTVVAGGTGTTPVEGTRGTRSPCGVGTIGGGTIGGMRGGVEEEGRGTMIGGGMMSRGVGGGTGGMGGTIGTVGGREGMVAGGIERQGRRRLLRGWRSAVDGVRGDGLLGVGDAKLRFLLCLGTRELGTDTTRRGRWDRAEC